MIDIYGGMGKEGMTLSEGGGPGASANTPPEMTAGKGGGTDWNALLKQIAQGVAGFTPGGSKIVSPPAPSPATGTSAAPMDFGVVQQFLASLSGTKPKSGGNGGSSTALFGNLGGTR